MGRSVVVPFTNRRVPECVPPTPQARVPAPRSIRRQLSNIMKSDGFIRAERMKRFLEFVVEETLAGHANQLCEYTIGISVFARDSSFQPALDPIVRNDARRLRQKLLEYYQHCGSEDQVVIEVPKGGYVPAFRCALQLEPGSVCHQYRLAVSLIRADGMEVWTTDQDFQLTVNPKELCFALRLEVSRQKSAVSTVPISEYSVKHNKQQRNESGWNRIRRSVRNR
ncbi:MAG: hypothetical protein ACJ74Z_09155 [Bryobacteraceae bacterium]|jgi:hypothetical protein